MKKNCQLCGEPFMGKRSDAKYCSNSCKSKYFELKSKTEIKKNDTLSGVSLSDNRLHLDNNLVDKLYNTQISEYQTKLRNVDIDDLTPFDNILEDDLLDEPKIVEPTSKHHTNHIVLEKQSKENNLYERRVRSNEQNNDISIPEKYTFKTVKIDNPDYQDCIARLKKCRVDITNYKSNINKMQVLLKQLTNKLHKDLGGRWMDYSELNAEYQKQEERIKKVVEGCRNFIFEMEKQEKNILIELPNYPAYIDEKEKTISLLYTYWQAKQKTNTFEKELGEIRKKQQENQNEPRQVEDHQQFLNVNSKEYGNSNDIVVDGDETQAKPKEVIVELENSKISSMKKIANLKFQLLNFKGKWNDFFGLPQTNFFCVIHGMSGEGKTNFSIQFAKYLAENFGNVLYVSGEEGFAPTFQQKIKALGADTVSRLYAADIRTGQEILTEIPNRYHFIVIDSVNNMDIDPDMMKAIRNKFKQSGIIAICQSTKDGKIRGSYQIVHDSDMAVKVVNGLAVTTKNRFKEKHQEFDVFAVYNKSNPKMIKKITTDDDFDGLSFDNTIK